MFTPKVEEVDLPKGTLVARCFLRIGYADAYRARLPAGSFPDVDSIARRIVESPPWWVQTLMMIRDRIVAVIGLKAVDWDTVGRESITFEPGSSVRGFRVFERTDNEIVLGGDDSHLDFRVSILRQTEGGDSWAVVSTVVRFNNFLGGVYFVLIKPAHRIIVRAMIRRAIRR